MDAFRIHLAGHPLLLTLALVGVLWLVSRVMRPRLRRERPSAWLGHWLSAAGLAALVAYACVVVYYVTDPHYFDAAEPTMTAVGWLFQKGQPIYHAVDSAERYAHIYGPLAFMAHGVALGVFGPSIEVSKWVGGSLALASLVLIVVALKPQAGVRRAVVLAGLCALVMLGFRNYSFWTRAEPLMAFCVSAGLVAVVRGNGYVAAGALGVFAGLLWNLKMTGPIYSVPLFVMLQRRLGWRPALLSAALASVIAALPFLLPNVSLTNYLAWFRLSASNGLTGELLTRNLEWAVYLLVPLWLAGTLTRPRARSGADDWPFLCWTVVATTGGIVIVASKPGAGPYHLMALLPIIAFLIAERMGLQSPEHDAPALTRHTLASFVVVAAAIALVQQVQFVTTMEGRRALHQIRDIQAFADQHRGVVEMGYGVNNPTTFERPVLVFRNSSYLIDAPAVGEHQLAGVDIPPATIEALRRCRVNYWLIPKGDAPFSGRNMYRAMFEQPLFPDEFRRVFHETHTLVTSTEYFDAWQCNPVR